MPKISEDKIKYSKVQLLALSTHGLIALLDDDDDIIAKVIGRTEDMIVMIPLNDQSMPHFGASPRAFDIVKRLVRSKISKD